MTKSAVELVPSEIKPLISKFMEISLSHFKEKELSVKQMLIIVEASRWVSSLFEAQLNKAGVEIASRTEQ